MRMGLQRSCLFRRVLCYLLEPISPMYVAMRRMSRIGIYKYVTHSFGAARPTGLQIAAMHMS